MSWYEYTCVLSGHIQRSNKLWEHTRSTNYMLYVVNSTEKNKMSITDFMPLLTDKKSEVVTLSQEDKEEMSRQAIERAAQLAK